MTLVDLFNVHGVVYVIKTKTLWWLMKKHMIMPNMLVNFAQLLSREKTI